MSTNPEFSTYSFPTASAFSTFLSANHTTLPGLYLKLAKKSSKIPSITAAEAVEVALCHGWIDGRANALDDSYWTVRYTPRRAKSIWSQKNVATVARLIEDGRMTPAGLEQVDAAKRDGRWERAYAGPAGIEVPGDFVEVLKGEGEETRGFWEGLNKGQRYSVLQRLQTCSVKGRVKVIEGLVKGLREGRVPGVGGKGEVEKLEGVRKEKISKVKLEKPMGIKKEKVVRKTAADRKKVVASNEHGSAPAKKSAEANPSRREGLRSGPNS